MPTSEHEPSLPIFISNKIDELRTVKSIETIAQEAGFRSVETLRNVINGSVRLHGDRVADLAEALGLEAPALMRMTLQQWGLTHVAEVLDSDIDATERALINQLRTLNGDRPLRLGPAVQSWVEAFPGNDDDDHLA